jgi:hypothetical protein
MLATRDSGASVREVTRRLIVSPFYVVKMRQHRAGTGETGRLASKIAAHLKPLCERVIGQLAAGWRALNGLGLTLQKSRSALESRTTRT